MIRLSTCQERLVSCIRQKTTVGWEAPLMSTKKSPAMLIVAQSLKAIRLAELSFRSIGSVNSPSPHGPRDPASERTASSVMGNVGIRERMSSAQSSGVHAVGRPTDRRTQPRAGQP